MSERQIIEPTAEHPITVGPAGVHVSVRIGGELLADTRDAQTLRESTYPAVYYIPLSDVRQTALSGSDTTTYCPYKGEATYYDVTTSDGSTVKDAIWTYTQPYPAVADIAGHVAFYADKAEITADKD